MKYNYCLLAGLLLTLGGATALTGCSEDFSGQIEILYNLIKDQESRLSALEKRVAELEKKLEGMEPGGNYDELKTEINNLKAEISRLWNEINNLKQQTEANTEAIEKLNKELDALENQVNTLQNAFANRIQSATFKGSEGRLYYIGGTRYRVAFEIKVAPYESASNISDEDWKKYLSVSSTYNLTGGSGPKFTVNNVSHVKDEDGDLLLKVEADADFGQTYWKNEDGNQETNYSLNAHIDNGKPAGDVGRITMNVQGTPELRFLAATRIDEDKDYTFTMNGKVIDTAEDSGFLRFDESNTYPMAILGNKTYNGTTYTQITDPNRPVFSGKVTAQSSDGKYKDLEVNYTVVSVYKDRLTEVVALPRAYVNVDENSALYMSKDLWEAETVPATNLENYLVVLKLQAQKGITTYGAPGYIAVKLTK